MRSAAFSLAVCAMLLSAGEGSTGPLGGTDMLHRWTTTRSWLVAWELLALVWFAVAVNRYARTDAIVSFDVGVTPMAWALLMDFIVAAAFSATCAVIGLIPAAWKALGPSRVRAERASSVSSGPTSEQAGQSISA